MSLLSRFRRADTHDPQARPVLVVEDDAGLRAYIVSILEHHGYRVIAAGSGEEAFELLQGERAQLAVLDVGLPGMDGLAVAEQLADEVPVIVVTGDPEHARKASARTRVGQGLEKPLTPEDLEQAVENAL